MLRLASRFETSSSSKKTSFLLVPRSGSRGAGDKDAALSTPQTLPVPTSIDANAGAKEALAEPPPRAILFNELSVSSRPQTASTSSDKSNHGRRETPRKTEDVAIPMENLEEVLLSEIFGAIFAVSPLFSILSLIIMRLCSVSNTRFRILWCNIFLVNSRSTPPCLVPRVLRASGPCSDRSVRHCNCGRGVGDR